MMNIAHKMKVKREVLGRRLAVMEQERKEIHAQIKLLDDLEGKPGVVRLEKKGLIDIAIEVLNKASGIKMVSSEVANKAVDDGIWTDPPPSYLASISGALKRAALKESSRVERESFNDSFKSRVMVYWIEPDDEEF